MRLASGEDGWSYRDPASREGCLTSASSFPEADRVTSRPPGRPRGRQCMPHPPALRAESRLP
ncbi:hypothetical protein AALO_G00181380 [Alosa alosa]|uniref:Uncharacterized protein n=1 Tax=Alosa alosa TaxID=278164 RepID=A0AAV6G939_9TELE|nr:hypothetical protein AALO_G00181380 [Alosa alosa]